MVTFHLPFTGESPKPQRKVMLGRSCEPNRALLSILCKVGHGPRWNLAHKTEALGAWAAGITNLPAEVACFIRAPISRSGVFFATISLSEM